TWSATAGTCWSRTCPRRCPARSGRCWSERLARPGPERKDLKREPATASATGGTAMSTLITNIGELVTNAPPDAAPDDRRAGRFASVRSAAVVMDAGRVAWTGPASRAPAADQIVDARGRAVLPGFVGSHAQLGRGGEGGGVGA